jgi:hypothetical protein
VAPLGRERTQFGSQAVKIGLQFDGQRLPQDFAVLGFHRTPVPGRAALQTQDEFVVEVANMKMAGHGVGSLNGDVADTNDTRKGLRYNLAAILCSGAQYDGGWTLEPTSRARAACVGARPGRWVDGLAKGWRALIATLLDSESAGVRACAGNSRLQLLDTADSRVKPTKIA